MINRQSCKALFYSGEQSKPLVEPSLIPLNRNNPGGVQALNTKGLISGVNRANIGAENEPRNSSLRSGSEASGLVALALHLFQDSRIVA
jgi:hypothetical protein